MYSRFFIGCFSNTCRQGNASHNKNQKHFAVAGGYKVCSGRWLQVLKCGMIASACLQSPSCNQWHQQVLQQATPLPWLLEQLQGLICTC